MKKVLVLFTALLAVFLLVGCEPGSDENEAPAIKLNGNARMTIPYGIAFSDPGAYVEDGETYLIATTGSVDVFTSGTYQITYSYNYQGERQEITRVVVVEEELQIDFRLIGDEVITINLGESYTDPGVHISDSSIVPTITDDIDINTPGLYTINFSIVVDSKTYTLERTLIIQDPSTTLAFYLLGDETINLTVGATFTDPGYYVNDDSIPVTVNGTVDTSTVGVYTITYTVTDTTLTRTVNVITGTVSDDYYTVNSAVQNDNSLTVDITGNEPYTYYSKLEVQIYKDDIFYESQNIVDGSNVLVFTNLDREADYKALVYGEYSEGVVLIDEEDIFFTFTVLASPIPSAIISNQAVTDTTLSFDYSVTDPNSAATRISFFIYDENDSQVATSLDQNLTSGTITITNLQPSKTYKIKVHFNYNDENSLPKISQSYFNMTTSTSTLTTGFDTYQCYILNDNYKCNYTINNPYNYTYDVGAEIAENSVVLETFMNVSTDFNFSTPVDEAEKIITLTLTYTDENNTLQTVTETVTIEAYADITLDAYECSILNNAYTCTYTITNSANISYSLQAILYEGSTLLEELTDPIAGFSFTTPVDQNDKRVALVFTYNNRQGIQQTILEDITISQYTAPVVNLSGELKGENTLEFDYAITSNDGIVTSVDANIYQGSTLIDSKTSINVTSGHVIFTGLDFNTEYKYEIEITYTDNEAATQTLQESKLATTNNTSVPVGQIEITSFDTDKEEYDIDEVGYLLITINNPHNYPIESIQVSNQTKTAIIEGNVYKILLETGTETTYTRNLNLIKYTYNSVSTNHTIYTDFSYTVTDMSEPIVPTLVEIRPEFDHFNDDDYGGQTQLNSYVDFIFDNPENYEITEITLTNYSEAQWITKNITSTPQVVRYDMTFDIDTEDFTVSSFKYIKDTIEYTVNLQYSDLNTGHSEYCATTTTITNVADIVEMVTVGASECYIMGNDVIVDGNVYDWDQITNNAVISDIRLYGEGHTISGLTMDLGTTVTTLTKVGLFSKLEDSYVYDLNLANISINIPNSSKSVYAGGLAGDMGNSYIENVSVSGTVTLNHVVEMMLGGLIGNGMNNTINQVRTDVDISGTLQYSYDTAYLTIGGLVGTSIDEMYMVSAVGDFDVTDGSNNPNAMIGGIAGSLNFGAINHAYFGDGYMKVMQGTYVGGIVGYLGNSAIVNHTFVKSYIYNEPTYMSSTNTGGIIGYNYSGTVKNSVVVLNVYGDSIYTGLIEGNEQVGAVVSNSYHINTLSTYNNGSSILAHDRDLSGVNTITGVTPLEISDFWIELGFNDAIWNFTTLDVHMSMPIFE